MFPSRAIHIFLSEMVVLCVKIFYRICLFEPYIHFAALFELHIQTKRTFSYFLLISQFQNEKCVCTKWKMKGILHTMHQILPFVNFKSTAKLITRTASKNCHSGLEGTFIKILCFVFDKNWLGNSLVLPTN